MAVTLLIASSSRQARGDITYQLVNNPAYQSGWTLSGSITTDGTLGAISTTDIMSWTWTATNAGGTFTITGSSTIPIIDYTYAVTLQATASELTIPYSTSAALQLFYTPPAWPSPGTEIWGLTWYGGQLPPSPTDQHPTYYGDDLFVYQPTPPYLPLEDYGWDNLLPPPNGPNDTYVIATTASVPEPSTIVIAGLAGVCGIAYCLARKLRAQRKPMIESLEQLTNGKGGEPQCSPSPASPSCR